MNILNKVIKPAEIKEAYEILNNLEGNFSSNAFHLIKEPIKKTLNKHPKEIVELIKKGQSVKEWVLSAIANLSGDFIESGQYHLYRGVVNPMGPGGELIKIYNKAIDKLVEMDSVTAEEAEVQKSVLQENITTVG